MPIALFSVAVGLSIHTHVVAQKNPISAAYEPYSLSYAAGKYDRAGTYLGGTELMNLAPFGEKLYAGVGYWMDRPRLFSSWPFDRQSGAQILVLNSKSADWSAEKSFSFEFTRLSTMEVVRFHRFNAAGNITGHLAEMLVVGLDGKGGAVYTQKGPGLWEDTLIPTRDPVRSLAVHYDPIDRIEKLFAGGGHAVQNVGSIYSGIYDPTLPGRIHWDPAAEPSNFSGRIMSMVDCDGTLFAAAKPAIYRRNDRNKNWEEVYSYPIRSQFDQSKYASGFRGLTCIYAGGKPLLLTGFEGIAGDILRIDPETRTASVELRAREFLTERWGSPPIEKDIITGYNDIPLLKNSPELRVFALLARSPNAKEQNSAWFLSRTNGNSPRYELHEVRAPGWPNNRSDSALWSVRAIAISPFAEDQGQVLYMGGYDGHFEPVHNTAWLARVGINAALEPYKRD
jgi:hypothetical protein